MQEFVINFEFARKNFPIFLKITVLMNHLFHLSYSSCLCKGNSAGISSLVLSDSDKTESMRRCYSYWWHSNASWRKLPVDIQKTIGRKETYIFLSMFILKNFRGKNNYSDAVLYYLQVSLCTYCLFLKKWPENMFNLFPMVLQNAEQIATLIFIAVSDAREVALTRAEWDTSNTHWVGTRRCMTWPELYH